MKTNDKIQVMVLASLIVMAVLLFPLKTKAVSDIGLFQSILPVKFIYLDDRGEINNIWSNATDRDSLYVVKFFDKSKKNEINANGKLMMSYKKSIVEGSWKLNEKLRQKNNGYEFLSVDFLEERGTIEEVRTLA